MFHGQGWRKPIHGPRLAGRLKPFRPRQPTREAPRPREERPSAAPSWWLANPHRNPLPPPRLRPAPTHSVSLGAPRHTSAPLLEIPLLIRRVIITPPLPPPSPTKRSPSTLRASTSSIVAVTSHPGPWITLRDRSAALARTCGSMHSGKEVNATIPFVAEREPSCHAVRMLTALFQESTAGHRWTPFPRPPYRALWAQLGCRPRRTRRASAGRACHNPWSEDCEK